jgi:hypothetical protein
VRGWLRSFGRWAASLAGSFAALAVELGGEALTPLGDPRRHALAAMAAAWRAASALPGWLAAGPWRFCWSVCGGTLVATNTNSPYLLARQTSFHASCQMTTTRQEMTTWTKPTLKRWHCTAGR